MSLRPALLRARIGAAASRGAVLAAAITDVARGRVADSATGAPDRSITPPLALRGTVWTGGDNEPYDGVVLIDEAGRIDRIGSAEAISVPPRLPVLGGPGHWVGPGITDAHVHLAFGGPDDAIRGGVLGVRDLGSPQSRARSWQAASRRHGLTYVAASGPILTAPRGYPSRSWGSAGFAFFIADEDEARTAVHILASGGSDLIKIALEPGPGWAVPRPRVVHAVARAAHDRGLAVVAHALSVEMVTRALDAEVDELAHTPTELLPEEVVDRIAEQSVTVSSTLQTFYSAGQGENVGKNAAAMVRSGVRLVYGTDLGNAGTTTGVDPRELDRLAQAGLGRRGALLAATEGSAAAAGLDRSLGVLTVGRTARCVVLAGDPLVEPGLWRRPAYVLAGGAVFTGSTPSSRGTVIAT